MQATASVDIIVALATQAGGLCSRPCWEHERCIVEAVVLDGSRPWSCFKRPPQTKPQPSLPATHLHASAGASPRRSNPTLDRRQSAHRMKTIVHSHFFFNGCYTQGILRETLPIPSRSISNQKTSSTTCHPGADHDGCHQLDNSRCLTWFLLQPLLVSSPTCCKCALLSDRCWLGLRKRSVNTKPQPATFSGSVVVFVFLITMQSHRHFRRDPDRMIMHNFRSSVGYYSFVQFVGSGKYSINTSKNSEIACAVGHRPISGQCCLKQAPA